MVFRKKHVFRYSGRRIQLLAKENFEADLIESEDVMEEIRDKIRAKLGEVYYDSKVNITLFQVLKKVFKSWTNLWQK